MCDIGMSQIPETGLGQNIGSPVCAGEPYRNEPDTGNGIGTCIYCCCGVMLPLTNRNEPDTGNGIGTV